MWYSHNLQNQPAAKSLKICFTCHNLSDAVLKLSGNATLQLWLRQTHLFVFLLNKWSWSSSNWPVGAPINDSLCPLQRNEVVHSVIVIDASCSHETIKRDSRMWGDGILFHRMWAFVTDVVIFMDGLVGQSPVQFGDLILVPMIVLLALLYCKLHALDEAVPENSAPRRLGGSYL